MGMGFDSSVFRLFFIKIVFMTIFRLSVIIGILIFGLMVFMVLFFYKTYISIFLFFIISQIIGIFLYDVSPNSYVYNEIRFKKDVYKGVLNGIIGVLFINILCVVQKIVYFRNWWKNLK